MSFVDNGGNMTMPVQPMGNGGGSGFWGDGSFWIIILFLFAFMGNGWGGFGGGGNAGNEMQRGFDQQSVMSGIAGINSSLANAEVSRCNSQANILATLNNNSNNQMTAMNGLAMSLQNCCCENRAGLADLKYTVATEACSDRQTVNDGLRDILAAQTANTQALVNSTNAGFKGIMDKICQLEMDSKNQQIQDLQSRLQMATLRESQEAQTRILEQHLNPTPIPAYMVQNPNCCSSLNYGGCGCGA